jgi:hypothetical protein
MSVSCEFCVLSSRGPCSGLINRPESPAKCGVCECDRKTSTLRSPWSILGVEP